MSSLSIPPGQWRRRRGSINSSMTSTVLQVGLGDFRSIEIVASFFNTAQDETKHLSISIINSGGGITDIIHSKIGGIPLTIESVKDGTVLKVNVKNNAGYQIKYNWLVAFFKDNF